MKPKQIAISATILGTGGIETHVRLLATLLAKSGYDVVIYGNDCQWSKSTLREINEAGVKLVVPPKAIRRFPKFAKIYAILLWLLNRPSRAICLYGIGAGISHQILKWLAGKQVFTINHEIVSPPSINCSAANCIKRTDFSIANSHYVAKIMRSMFRDKPIKVIPFLTSDSASNQPVPREPAGQCALNIGYLGRLETRKRPHILVKEWLSILNHPSIGEAVLHIHGADAGGGMLCELKAFVADNGLENAIILHGGYKQRDVSSILANLDLVVLPSEWEGLPLVLVESMQHGVPFVATCAGGTAEFQIDNQDVLVTGLEWQEFVEGLVSFIPRIRNGDIDARRLHQWVENRYGYDVVWPMWKRALTENGREFFLSEGT